MLSIARFQSESLSGLLVRKAARCGQSTGQRHGSLGTDRAAQAMTGTDSSRNNVFTIPQCPAARLTIVERGSVRWRQIGGLLQLHTNYPDLGRPHVLERMRGQ